VSIREKVDHILNECTTLPGQIFEVFISLLVCIMSMIFIAETYPLPEDLYHNLTRIETGITFFFLIEYLVRWWSKKCSLKYLFTPMAIIDLLAILPLFLPTHFQFVRLLRLFRILRLVRFFQSNKLIFKKLTDYHISLIRILFSLFCIVFVSAGLIYDVENDIHNTHFKTFFDAVYFAIVTLSTVGFGDLTPLSFLGRTITLLMIVTGAIVIPWQVSDFLREIVATTSKSETECKQCHLAYHDSDAKFCKSCGKKLKILKNSQSGAFS